MALIGVVDARSIIGRNLRRLRVAKGLSQERLAGEAGIDRSYVGRIERGSENMSITTLEVLAAALGVEVRALFDPVPVGSKPQAGLRAGRKPQVG